MEEKPERFSSRKENRELRKHMRESLQKDWLAPAGSEREKQFLRTWIKHADLTQAERDEISLLMNKTDEDVRRNHLFWHSAKKAVLGPVVYEIAMQRHKTLNDDEWLVACFTARGFGQKEIGSLMQMGERMVDNTIRSLKDKIIQESNCDINDVDRAQIACWFFGT